MRLQFYKHSVPRYETDLMSVVNSLILSFKETELHVAKSGQCNGSCIRSSLVKLLRLSGYDAAVCSTRWQGSDKVPGGIYASAIFCYNFFWLNHMLDCIEMI